MTFWWLWQITSHSFVIVQRNCTRAYKMPACGWFRTRVKVSLMTEYVTFSSKFIVKGNALKRVITLTFARPKTETTKQQDNKRTWVKRNRKKMNITDHYQAEYEWLEVDSKREHSIEEKSFDNQRVQFPLGDH
jgi:hypothetical protein